MLAAPVLAGLCSWSDYYSLHVDDLHDMNEILIVKAENERRARVLEEARQREAARKRR